MSLCGTDWLYERGVDCGDDTHAVVMMIAIRIAEKKTIIGIVDLNRLPVTRSHHPLSEYFLPV